MTDRPETERVDALAEAMPDFALGTDVWNDRKVYAAAQYRALTGLGWSVERARQGDGIDVEQLVMAMAKVDSADRDIKEYRGYAEAIVREYARLAVPEPVRREAAESMLADMRGEIEG